MQLLLPRSPACLLALSLAFTASPARAATCWTASTTQARSDLAQLGTGLRHAPHAFVQPSNLKWELPVAAATAALIAAGDGPASRQIHSQSLQSHSSTASNVGLGVELGLGAISWAAGCETHREGLRDTGQTALEAVGAAALADLALKEATARSRPYVPHDPGEFWQDDGTSFPSGHAAMSFAAASVFAHRYANRPWIKWGSYALATAVTLARFGARRHFLSDLVVGSTLGYVTGTYLSGAVGGNLR